MPTKKDITVSVGKMGMNKDVHMSALKPEEYSHAKNSNFFDESGNGFNIQNEHSNLLASRFKSGFKVVGVKNDVISNSTYYFLTNPTTKVSEIGQIKDTHTLPDLGDEIVNCKDCEYKVNLSEPLENQQQNETQTYITLLNDECNSCLNFDVNKPVKSIEIKNEKCGKVMYFTDNLNPPRYIELDNLEKYSYEGEELCGDDSTVNDTCVACEKMRIFKKSKILDIVPSKIVVGGNLKRGTYEFLGAYCDEMGNEISRYFSITNPISIFDENNNILQQENIADETNFAIKLDVNNLDTSYTHYKIAVIQRTDINYATSYFVEGVHSTSDNTIIYTTDQGKERTSLNELNIPAVRVEKWKSLTASNGYLFGNGITYSKRMNLQPVVNLMGVFLNWQTYIAKEDLYKDGIAASKYKGYYRDETYPLGIRFLLDGEYSPTYHFIGRPPKEQDTEIVDNIDSESANKLSGSCVDADINKRWQIYNTAKELGSCTLSEDIPTNTITEEVSKVCYVESVGSLSNGSFSIALNDGEDYVDLETYINTNRDALIALSNNPLCEDNNQQGLCELANLINPENYSDANCQVCTEVDSEGECDIVFGEACNVNPIPASEEIQLLSENIVRETTTRVEKQFPSEYAVTPPPEDVQMYERDFSDGSFLEDEEFERSYGRFPSGDVFDYYTRDFSFINTACSYAEQIQKFSYTTNFRPGYFHNYYGADTESELKTDKISLYTSGTISGSEGLFSDSIQQGALWFKKEITNNKFLIDITPQTEGNQRDKISRTDPNTNYRNSKVRVNIFNSCSDTTALFSEPVDLEEGAQYLFEYNTDDNILQINKTDGTTELVNITSSDFLVAIDTPILETSGYTNGEDAAGGYTTRYRTLPTEAAFSIVEKAIEYDRIEVTFDSISVNKKQTYIASCDFEVPVVEDCEAFPYKFGEFAYTESTEEYPDNEQLYDSSKLVIDDSDIPEGEYYEGVSFRDYFKDNFVFSTTSNGYSWKTDSEGKPIVDFRCNPIRHFKFPDNNVSPFMYENRISAFTESIIHPIGITINEELVNSFLDVAVKNKLITQEDRSKITGYEIVRGDRTANESVVAKGITFDMMEYEEDRKKILYSNYPLNDLGSDRLNYQTEQRNSFIPHPYNSVGNHNWTFTSPETDYNRTALPTFMKVEGNLYGRSRGYIDAVRDHPKWVILGRKLKNLASTLATIEVATETAVTVAQALANTNLVVGFTNTVFPGGIVASAIIAGIETLSGIIFRYARYKYEWLTTFRNLGMPRNFAYYMTEEGYLNYFKPNVDELGDVREGNTFRYLNVAKNIKDGRYILTDSVGGDKLEINHRDREETALLSVGKDMPIIYPSEYITYDNSDEDFNSSSRTFASENNACSKGLSPEIERNAASMYISLKNYLPSQYGTIGSVKWLTTGYRGDLSNPRTSCVGIFGGDVFITRHTLRRPFPLFNTTAMNQASLTPFEYKFYSNIGKEPRFFCNYEINSEDLTAGKPLPDIDSEYSFDCFPGSGSNYIEEPSKFYLYYNGIPNFLTESTINTWNRYGKPEPWNNFYPNFSDMMEWTQEVVNPIRRGNTFFYNNTYSKNVTQTATLTLPDNYDKEEYDCKADAPNGTMYSLLDNSENAYVDPWLIFRPLDKYEFPSSYGDLIELRGIETGQVLGRFTDTTVLFNAVDTLIDNGQSPDAQVLGTGGIFARRPRTFANTDLGYAGTQSFQMVSNEYGHFFPDAERGGVFKMNSGGQGLEEISAVSAGQPSGMKHWFKEHLPFKIKKYFPEIDIDNPYNGAGISMGWDSRYKRVFITKKDYIPKKDLCYSNGNFSTTDSQEIENVIAQYEGQGYTYKGVEDCKLKFEKEGIPSTTDIYAFFDTSSMIESDGITAAESLNMWFNDYKASNPNYQGNLYILPYLYERWLDYANRIVTGNIQVDTSGGWMNIAQVPDNLNTPQWVAPTNVAVLAFVDEATPEYHTDDLASGFGAAISSRIQPTASYINDLNTFINNYNNHFDYFQGVVYPIPRDTTGITAALVLQSVAAIEGTTLTQSEIDSLGSQIDLSLLLTENPYQELGGLKDYGWEGVFDKYSPASEVISSEVFTQELTDIVLGAIEEDIVYGETAEVQLSDKEYFEDVSWTISYNLETGRWGSFFDFKPNYYVSHNDYFQTGINVTEDETEFGVWSHLLTNKSYQVFYGKAYDWEIELPVQNKNTNRYLESFMYNLDARRYFNEYDYAQNKEIGFEEAIIWNHSNNSGKLKLDLQKTVRQISKYPKTNKDSQSILQVQQDGEFRFNYFYNRVKQESRGLPLWNWDENQIEKELNRQAISFYGKRTLERLRGTEFLVNLKSKETQHKKIFKISQTKENLYDK